MVVGEVRLVHRVAQVPGGVPVAHPDADAAFAEDGGPDPFIERGDVQRLLRAERVADGAQSSGLHARPARQHIERSLRVPKHLSHAAPRWPSLSQSRDRLVESAASVAIKIIARADRGITSPGQVEADVILGRRNYLY